MVVAPRAGAWIETSVLSIFLTLIHRSPLAQGRGLKRADRVDCRSFRGSPLAQGRGLKHDALPVSGIGPVAPRAGAWIETCNGNKLAQ